MLIDSSLRPRVADFGLSRGDVADLADAGVDASQQDSSLAYYHAQDNSATELPVKWTAIEALMSRRFCEATDVWSFGIVAVEIYQVSHHRLHCNRFMHGGARPCRGEH